MKIGYVRVSRSDGTQSFDLQKDAMLEIGVKPEMIYEEYASGKDDNRPQLQSCLKSLREGDTLVLWKLDRLGRNLKNLVEIVTDLSNRNIGLKVISGAGACIETSTPHGRMIFTVFAALAEYERELLIERTKAGLAAARARGRCGGRKFKMTKTKLNIAQTALKNRNTKTSELCKELGITKYTLYRYLSPEGELRRGSERVR